MSFLRTKLSSSNLGTSVYKILKSNGKLHQTAYQEHIPGSPLQNETEDPSRRLTVTPLLLQSNTRISDSSIIIILIMISVLINFLMEIAKVLADLVTKQTLSLNDSVKVGHVHLKAAQARHKSEA